MWTDRLVVFFVVINLYSLICDANRLEEFLEEKQSEIDEFNLLFETTYLTYFNSTPNKRVGSTNSESQRQVLSSQPLPAPDWSTHSTSFAHVNEEETDEDLDASEATFSEEENYRPRAEASGREPTDENSSDEENVFSGDSGLFITEQPGDDDEGYEDLGSGDSRTDSTTNRQTTSVLKETSTSIPVEPNDALNVECKNHLNAEIASCIEFSLNVRTMFQEMETFVDQSGYYNVSTLYYLQQLFRTCASTLSSPSSCLKVSTNKKVMDFFDEIISYTTTHSSQESHDGTTHGPNYLDCFQTHLQLLHSCLGSRTTNAQLETLARMILVRAKDGSPQECQDLEEVERCVVGSMTRCVDSVSVGSVEEMFEATRGVLKTCSAEATKGSVNDAAVPSGTVVTLVFSILALGLHKQTRD